MQVIVKSKHLRGNSWSHGAETRCPLHMALVEAGHKNVDVGAWIAQVDGERVNIPVIYWNSDTVQQYIKDADEGSEKEHVIDFITEDESTLQISEVIRLKNKAKPENVN